MRPRILVAGAGGREHALIRQLDRSPQNPLLFAAPGNPGTANLAENLDVDPADSDRLVDVCRHQRIDLVLVGPEDPLIAGVGDHLRAAGIAVFGPGADGARLEGDKEFAKEILTAAGVPTASFAAFSSSAPARAYLEQASFPVVVKACGAAQGKGVAVCPDREAAERHVELCLSEGKFGTAGARILIEECLTGPELSVLAVTDGEDYALLAPSRDHKRVGEGDTGPNTGGMGAFAPVTLAPSLYRRIGTEIIIPTLGELRRRNIPYRGVLYAGLMLTPTGPQVLEFNCRFGDPETQVVLPLLRGDFLALVQATAAGCLGEHLARSSSAEVATPDDWPGAALTDWQRHCVVIVGAAAGYPGGYDKGTALQIPPDAGDDAWIIHAGTCQTEQGLVTAGGRVLGAVGCGHDLASARDIAYDLVRGVACSGLFYRTDIAASADTAEG